MVKKLRHPGKFFQMPEARGGSGAFAGGMTGKLFHDDISADGSIELSCGFAEFNR